MKRNQRVNILAGVTVTVAAILMSALPLSVSAEESNAKENKAIEWTAMTDAYVSIEFDSAGCPQLVNPPDFFVHKAKRVIWQSVDAAGNKFPQTYEIYFDPFKGSPLRSGPSGEVKSSRFDPNAPATARGIEYKYSIVGEKCKNKPLDPRFRVR